MSGQAYTDASSPSEKRGISASEKYLDLAERGEERPRCKCHGEVMRWNKGRGRKDGGYWKCLVSHRATSRAARLIPGVCFVDGCSNPKQRYVNGTYGPQCQECRSRRSKHRYDSDPIWRHTRLMKKAMANRAKTLERMRESVIHQPTVEELMQCG